MTPELSVTHTRHRLPSIATTDTFGLRKRAVLGTLIAMGARIGTLAHLRIQDDRDQGAHRGLRFVEKGGEARDIPGRHDLEEGIGAYIEGVAVVSRRPRAREFTYR